LYNRPEVAAVPRDLVPPHKLKKNILVGYPEETSRLGSPRLRWKNNIFMTLKQTECDDVDWSPLAQYKVQWGTLVNKILNLRLP
jgi:hypothetical protein